MSDGYPYDDRPSKQEVREAAMRYIAAYGKPAAVEFLGYLGFKRLADIPGASYQYVIDCFDAELTEQGTDFVVPASPVPAPTPAADAKEAKRRENRRRWAEEAKRDQDDAYRYGKMEAMEDVRDREALERWQERKRRRELMSPERTLVYPRFDPAPRDRRPKVKVEFPEEQVEQKNWVEKRFGVLDV